MAAYSNLYIDQGSTFNAVIEVADINSDIIDISAYQARGQFRKSYSSNTYYNFTAQIINPEKGQIEISLSAFETSSLKAGKYVYDVELFNSINVYRILEGNVEITPEVTRPVGSIVPLSPIQVIRSYQETPTRYENDNSKFWLSYTPIAGSMMVFINGLYQNSSFYSIDGSTLTFNSNVNPAWNVSVSYQYIDQQA